MSDESRGLHKIFPMNKGDNFMLGPYHFICVGWENGRIIADRYEFDNRGRLGTIRHSLTPEIVLDSGFKMLRAKS